MWVVTHPKCGTTWMQELVWQVAHQVDLEGGKRELNERFPYLELDSLIDPAWYSGESLLPDVQWVCVVVWVQMV